MNAPRSHKDVISEVANLLATELKGANFSLNPEAIVELYGSPSFAETYIHWSCEVFRFGRYERSLDSPEFVSAIAPQVKDLAERIRSSGMEGIVFRPSPLPTGGIDAAENGTDTGNSLSVRIVSAYDISTDTFIARLACTAERTVVPA